MRSFRHPRLGKRIPGTGQRWFFVRRRSTNFLLWCWRADTLASLDQDLRDLGHEGLRESIAQNVDGSILFFGTVSSSGTLVTAQRA